ncbi:MAG: CPBP family intramembrane metalloprotease [Ignavibacteriae bacterium]|nr:CPBP family intramembrane metalloprotease [Ignavibacteriota bacterium]
MFYPLLGILQENYNGPIEFNYLPLWSLIIIILPIASFIETIIYFWLVFTILRRFRYFQNKYLVIILISSFLFGISHSYNYSYVIFTFFIGLLYGYSYFIAENKKLSPVLVVTIIHYLMNVFVYSQYYIFDWLKGNIF